MASDDLIERAAETMAGEDWASMSLDIQNQYREMSRRAATVFLPARTNRQGEAVEWELVELSVRMAVVDSRSLLTTRKAGDEAVDHITRRIVEKMRRSGFSYVFGPGAVGHSAR